MEFPQVTVTDISCLMNDVLPLGKKVDLGNKDLDQRVNALLKGIQISSEKAYILRWEGYKVPRGVVVGGETLAWTQNGLVHNNDGNIVGTYERVVEFGGESGKEQAMIVYMRTKRWK